MVPDTMSREKIPILGNVAMIKKEKKKKQDSKTRRNQNKLGNY